MTKHPTLRLYRHPLSGHSHRVFGAKLDQALEPFLHLRSWLARIALRGFVPMQSSPVTGA